MSDLEDFMAEMDGNPHSGTPPNDAPQADTENVKKRKKVQKAEVSKKPRVQENRAIYISNLPPDVTKEELDQEFSRFGIIDKGINGEPRIKFYTDDEGNVKNEALIVFFKKESIANAIRIMDGFPLRPGDDAHGDISVKEADPANKKVQDGDQVVAKLTRKDKKMSERNRAELNRYV
jgi:HIV Tat-specific factor 1